MKRSICTAGLLLALGSCIILPNPRPLVPWTTENGIEILETKAVEGQAAQLGDTLSLHYEMSLSDGSMVDSSRARGTEVSLVLGAGTVVPGLTDGLIGMVVGSIRELTVPAALGFGEKGIPPTVPPGATIHFEVELMGLTRPD